MKKSRISRRLQVEGLESRRLLAVGDPLALDHPGSDQRIIDTVDSGAFVDQSAASSLASDDVVFPPPKPANFVGLGPDFIHETEHHLFVVGQAPASPGGALHLFERNGDGELAFVEQIEFDFHASHLFVHGDQIVLVGFRQGHTLLGKFGEPLPAQAAGLDLADGSRIHDVGPGILRYSVLTVTMGNEIETVRQQLEELPDEIHLVDGALVTLAARTVRQEETDGSFSFAR
ncbi:MAG: hypothetical protein MI861_25910, partial [Pirellulales bacterium]|nr:hypothetical protein [Pirellulales bacterium]